MYPQLDESDQVMINGIIYTGDQINIAMKRYEKELERQRQRHYRTYVPHPLPPKVKKEEPKRPRGRPKKSPVNPPGEDEPKELFPIV